LSKKNQSFDENSPFFLAHLDSFGFKKGKTKPNKTDWFLFSFGSVQNVEKKIRFGWMVLV
jgi:hypothetical protein